jgi:hypothetical protein
MANAKLVKELFVQTKDKPGLLSEITSTIANLGVNILAICAYAVSGKAIFRILTSNNPKVKSILAKQGFKVEEKEVVTIMLEDRVGQAGNLASKLKAGKANLNSLYGTTCGCVGAQSLIVMGSANNKKVITAING